jgi:hypothetical protein
VNASEPTETTTGKWHYTGDVNPEYGGFWIDLSDWEYGYCSAVRVTDLDSGCGFRGAVLIEHIVINGTDDQERIKTALGACGCDVAELDQSDMRTQLMIAESLALYGFYDPDDFWDGLSTPHTETVQMESDGPMKFDGWTASKRLHNTSLRAYIESVHLS